MFAATHSRGVHFVSRYSAICLLLLAAGAVRLHAQTNCPSTGTTGSVFFFDAFSQSSQFCAQVTVPAGRQFVVLYVNGSVEQWQLGNGCNGDIEIQIMGSCSPPMTLQVSVTGTASPYQSAQWTAPSTPSGSGWFVNNNFGLQCINLACYNACKYQTDQTACLATQPASSEDTLIQYGTSYYQILPLSPATSQTGGTLTLQLIASPSLNNYAEIEAILYGDDNYTIPQTATSFRPMDARDPASNCPSAIPSNPPGDNCHLVYQVQAPLFPGAVFEQEPSPDGRTRGPGGAPKGAALGTLPALFEFTLTTPTSRATGQPAAWLMGTSTNYTPPNTDMNGPDPDYVIEQANNPGYVVNPNGLQAFTQSTSFEPPPLIVTSHDFGGKAELIGTATVQGYTFNINVVDSSGNPVQAPADGTTMLCGTDFARQPYASLPVDQDCNGIADSWEAPYVQAATAASAACGGPAIAGFTGTEDIEQGYTCTSPQGDGWSVHDEYRGFHYVPDGTALVTTKWTSTDPVNKFDIFFWPDGYTPPSPHGTKSSPPANGGAYTQALRQILCLQGSFTEMGAPQVPGFPMVTDFGPLYPNSGQTVGVPVSPPAVSPGTALKGYNYCTQGGINDYDPTVGPNSPPNPLRFWYRRVTADQANAASDADPPDATQGVGFFNKNSATSPNGNHTVMVYYSAPLGEGTFGATTNNLGTCPRCDEPLLAGTGVDLSQITTYAQKFGVDGRTMTPTTLTAEVIAHETGHWFQQNHDQRPNCCALQAGAKASQLNWQTYTTQGSGNSIAYLVGLVPYPYGSRSHTPMDTLACSGGQPQATSTIVTNLAPNPNMTVYTFNRPNTATGGVVVWNLLYELMDWTPSFSLANPTQWHFDPANRNALCAMNPCPTQWQGPTLCKP